MSTHTIPRTDPQQELLTRARRVSQKAGLLHAECIEQTLPARALALLARDVAHDANWILNRLTCCANFEVLQRSLSEAHDHVLGQGRR